MPRLVRDSPQIPRNGVVGIAPAFGEQTLFPGEHVPIDRSPLPTCLDERRGSRNTEGGPIEPAEPDESLRVMPARFDPRDDRTGCSDVELGDQVI